MSVRSSRAASGQDAAPKPRHAFRAHGRSASVVLFRVLDDLAVVRQLAALAQCNFAAQLGHVAQAFGDCLREVRARRRLAHFTVQRHAVLQAGIVDHQACLPSSGILILACARQCSRGLANRSLRSTERASNRTCSPLRASVSGTATPAGPRRHSLRNRSAVPNTRSPASSSTTSPARPPAPAAGPPPATPPSTPCP